MNHKIDENKEDKKNNINNLKEKIFSNDLQNKTIEELEHLYPEAIKNFFVSFKKLPNSNLLNNNEENFKDIYNEATKLFFSNILLSSKLKESLDKIEELKNKIKNLEESKSKINNIIDSNGISIFKKRIRKKKNEIERLYKCTFKNCDKSYGSENSLNQHLKIKHKSENIN